MLLAEVLNNHYRSVAVIGMGKNTGKTFTFNQLLSEAQQQGLTMALTTIGLDGEARDSLFHHDKPQVVINPGMIVANAKSLLVESGLDYEILGTTQINTPLGEIILARSLSFGKTVLAGPNTAHELAQVKKQLDGLEVDLLLVDGAVDRRSLSAPLVTDVAILAVGAEVAWDRFLLLEKLRHHFALLTLPPFKHHTLDQYLRGLPEDVKVVYLSYDGVPKAIKYSEFELESGLVESLAHELKLVYVRGLLSDDVLVKIMGQVFKEASFTLLAQNPTSIFLGPQSLQRLAAQNIDLRVLDAISVCAVTVNPFNSSYGFVDPIQMLVDVGRAVYPVPCLDLALGLRYVPEKEDVDAIS